MFNKKNNSKLNNFIHYYLLINVPNFNNNFNTKAKKK